MERKKPLCFLLFISCWQIVINWGILEKSKMSCLLQGKGHLNAALWCFLGQTALTLGCSWHGRDGIRCLLRHIWRWSCWHLVSHQDTFPHSSDRPWNEGISHNVPGPVGYGKKKKEKHSSFRCLFLKTIIFERVQTIHFRVQS